MNHKKKRAFFRKRSHTAPAGVPRFLDEATKKLMQRMRAANPVEYALIHSRISKRGRRIFAG